MTLKENFEKEKKKLARLSFGERLQYIFDYYKFWFLGIALVIVIGWGVGSAFLHNRPTGFYAMLLNAGGSDLSGQANENASAAFAAAAGLDNQSYKIIVDTSATFNPNDQSEFSIAQNAKIAALYQSHDLDIMVADPGVFIYYALNGSFRDLREVLDAKTLSSYEAKGQVYYIDQHVRDLLDQTEYGDISDVKLSEGETIANSDALKTDADADGDTSETLDDMAAFAANLMGLASVQAREDFVLPDPTEMETPIPVGIIVTDASWLKSQGLYQNTVPILGFAVHSEREDAAKQFLRFLEEG